MGFAHLAEMQRSGEICHGFGYDGANILQRRLSKWMRCPSHLQLNRLPCSDLTLGLSELLKLSIKLLIRLLEGCNSLLNPCRHIRRVLVPLEDILQKRKVLLLFRKRCHHGVNALVETLE